MKVLISLSAKAATEKSLTPRQLWKAVTTVPGHKMTPEKKEKIRALRKEALVLNKERHGIDDNIVKMQKKIAKLKAKEGNVSEINKLQKTIEVQFRKSDRISKKQTKIYTQVSKLEGKNIR